MAEAEPTTTADPPETGHEGSDSERLTRVENAVERIETALSRLVPGSHADAQQRTEAHLDRGSTVEDQVRAELAKAREEEQRQAAEAAAADADRSEREQMKADLAKLRETPPAAPVRRATKLLGWGDGR